jgi:DNA-binding response OmpR family regulator
MAKSVLLIDDEASLRNTVSRILTKAGFQIITAASGTEGLQKFSEEEIGLVYVDMRMPDMSGLDVLRSIRQQDNYVPVIVFSALNDEASFESAMQNGATEYLLKPLKPETLIQRTHELLGN